MKRSRFSETQVLGILKAGETGRTVADVCRANSVSESTYFKWKSKYGGMTAAEIRRLRELEEENRALKDLIEKKRLVAAERREAVDCLKAENEMSVRGACRCFELSRTVYRYTLRKRGDEPIVDALSKLAEKHPQIGFGKFYWMEANGRALVEPQACTSSILRDETL